MCVHVCVGTFSRDAMAVARSGPCPRSWRTCTMHSWHIVCHQCNSQLLHQVPFICSAPPTTIITGLLCNCSYSGNTKHLHIYSCIWSCSSAVHTKSEPHGYRVLLFVCVFGMLLVCVSRPWCELSRRVLASSGCTPQSTVARKVQALLSTGSPSLSTGKGRLELSVDRVSVCMVLLCCPSMQWV